MRLLVIVGLFAATLAGSPASALSPERHSLTYDETFKTSEICGFSIEFEWIGTGYGSVFVDGDGDFVRQLDRIRETLVVTNVKTGAAASGRDAYQLTGTKETLRRTGSWVRLGSPGMGIVLLDVGRVVVTSDGEITAIAGRHQWLNGDFDLLCQALGP
jgi:hypothetical protein